MLFTMHEVSKTYRGSETPVVALQNVSLKIDAGNFVAVRGPSGCGKSTLLLTAGTLLAPDDGEIIFLNERPYGMDSDARASFRGQHLGFVFQQFHLVPYLSVIENVMAPTLALPQTAVAVDSSLVRSRASDLLHRFGLGHRLSHTPSKLSSGERQRCALARALLNQPQLLLADEPTGNLDPENAEIVLAALRNFANDGGAVLLVTHDDRAASAADHTLWMDQGRLVQAELLKP